MKSKNWNAAGTARNRIEFENKRPETENRNEILNLKPQKMDPKMKLRNQESMSKIGILYPQSSRIVCLNLTAELKFEWLVQCWQRSPKTQVTDCPMLQMTQELDKIIPASVAGENCSEQAVSASTARQ